MSVELEKLRSKRRPSTRCLPGGVGLRINRDLLAQSFRLHALHCVGRPKKDRAHRRINPRPRMVPDEEEIGAAPRAQPTGGEQAEPDERRKDVGPIGPQKRSHGQRMGVEGSDALFPSAFKLGLRDGGSSELVQLLVNPINRFIRRGRARSQTNCVRWTEPLWSQLNSRLDMVNSGTVPGTNGNEFARIVAVRSADYHDDVAISRQFFRSGLAIFGRTTNRVEPANGGLRKPTPDLANEFADSRHRLGGLAHDAEVLAGREARNVVRRKHDLAIRIIFRQPAYFHMVALTDHHRMKPLGDQFRQCLMGPVDERTRGFEDREAQGAHGRAALFRSAVRRDDHIAGRQRGGIRFEAHPVPSEAHEDGFIVNQIAQHGHRTEGGSLSRERNGVANAKAHAEMLCAEDFHGTGICSGKLCIAK